MSSLYRSILNAQGSSFASTNSFEFDGSTDYVNVGTSSLGITSAITVSAWVKIPTSNTGGGGANIQEIICEDAAGGSNRNWALNWRHQSVSNKYFTFAVFHTNGSASAISSTGITPNDGQWHHLLGTYDGTTNANGLKLYVDGGTPFTATASSIGIRSTPSVEATIGAITGGGAWRFEGNIDEVAVWNSDRNADASTIYNGGVPNNLTSLSPVSWWRMGEAANYSGGTWTLTDQGSGGNDGTSLTIPAPPAQPSTDVPT